MMKLGKDCLLRVILRGSWQKSWTIICNCLCHIVSLSQNAFCLYSFHHFYTIAYFGTFTTYRLAFVPKTSYGTKLECNWL